jgi:hypothetical protein
MTHIAIAEILDGTVVGALRWTRRRARLAS